MSQQFHLDRFEEWLIHHKARQLVGKAGFMPCDVDDIRQDLRIDVLQRLASFDPGKSKRHSFVALVVMRAVATMLEKRRTAKRGGGRVCVSLNESVKDFEGNEVELYQTLDADMGQTQRSGQELSDLAVDIHAIVDRLPPEQRILCGHLRDKSICETARTMGIPRTTLNALVRKVREAFEAAGLHDYLRES